MITACKRGNFEDAMEALEAGADIYRRDECFEYALTYAFSPHYGNSTRLARALLDHQDKKVAASEKLLRACHSSDVGGLKAALENGAEPNFSEDSNEFPLLLAVRSNHASYEMASLLLRAGCYVDNHTKSGRSVLVEAIYLRKSLALVDLLLRFGCDPNAEGHESYTPVHFADTVDILERLVAAGADLRNYSYAFLTEEGRQRVRHVYEAWTPLKMLPRWHPRHFARYAKKSTAFGDAIRTLWLCLLRYRYMIHREVGREIVAYVAHMHRAEAWWPACEEFNLHACLVTDPKITKRDSPRPEDRKSVYGRRRGPSRVERHEKLLNRRPKLPDSPHGDQRFQHIVIDLVD